MAAVQLVLTIVFLTFSCDIVSGVKFLQEPQNVTLESSWKPFTLKCEIDLATPDGMDWTLFNGEKKEIFSSKTGVCTAGYSVDRPNNRTLNLIVHIRNSSVNGNYCCYADNGGVNRACSYVTVYDVPQSSHTDITEANGVTATVNITTSTYLGTTQSASSSDTAIIVVIVICGVGIIVLVILLICVFCRGCPIHSWWRNRGGLENGGNAPENGGNAPGNDDNALENENML